MSGTRLRGSRSSPQVRAHVRFKKCSQIGNERETDRSDSSHVEGDEAHSGSPVIGVDLEPRWEQSLHGVRFEIPVEE